MDLNSQTAEYTHKWLTLKTKPQPPQDHSLTWFVSAHHLYTAYACQAQIAQVSPYNFNELYAALLLIYPNIKTGRLPPSLKSTPVYTGLRYYSKGTYPSFGI